MLECEKDNVIEFLNTQDRATVTANKNWLKTRLRKLAKEHPDECEIVWENDDGSILAHIPARWIKINPPHEISEEQKEALLVNLQKARELRRSRREAAAREKRDAEGVGYEDKR